MTGAHDVGCPPRRALLIAVLVFASFCVALTALSLLPLVLGRSDQPLLLDGGVGPNGVLVAFDGPLALYPYPYLPLPGLLDAVPVKADLLLWGNPLHTWAGRGPWRVAWSVWSSSVSAGLLAWATARHVCGGGVAPAAITAGVSAGIVGWGHPEETLLAAFLVAACAGSRLGGAAALLVKQTAAALALPFLWANRHNRRFLLVSVGVAVGVLAPFLLADPAAFLRSVLFEGSPSEFFLFPQTVRGLVPWPSYMSGRVAWVAAAAVFTVWSARRWQLHPLTATAVIASARCVLFEPWPEPSHFTAGFVLCAAAAGRGSPRAAWTVCAAAAAFRLWYSDWIPLAWFFPELPTWPAWQTAPFWQTALWWTVALPLISVSVRCAIPRR